MGRLALGLAGLALLAACSEELTPLPPDFPIEPQSGSGGTAGSSSPQQGGAGGSAGNGAGLGGGGTSSGGTDSAGSTGTPSSGAAGQGGSSGDSCPDDPLKTAPGACGCGLPDTDSAEGASCVGLKSALLHRYDFEGEGTVVMDRVGERHGSVQGGGALSKVAGKGVVELSGGTAGPYVDLPNRLVSPLTSATLEVWLTWGGGDSWQRIFDFGDSSAAAEDTPADGKTYLFVTPTTDSTSAGTLRGVFSLEGGAAAAETRVSGTAALPQELAQVVLVVNKEAGQLELYMDGKSVGQQPFTGSLASLNDVNCWLGRSQFEADPELTGTLHDFRVYGAALSPAQVATSFAAGADPSFLGP